MDYGIASSGDTRSFAEEIFARVPHKTAGVNVSSLGCVLPFGSRIRFFFLL